MYSDPWGLKACCIVGFTIGGMIEQSRRDQAAYMAQRAAQRADPNYRASGEVIPTGHEAFVAPLFSAGARLGFSLLASAGVDAGGVTLANSISRGLVSEGGKLANVLGGIEAGVAEAAPTTADEALTVVANAARSAGLKPGTLSPGANGSLVLRNVGDVTTTMSASGQITVQRGADVVLKTVQ